MGLAPSAGGTTNHILTYVLYYYTICTVYYYMYCILYFVICTITNYKSICTIITIINLYYFYFILSLHTLLLLLFFPYHYFITFIFITLSLVLHNLSLHDDISVLFYNVATLGISPCGTNKGSLSLFYLILYSVLVLVQFWPRISPVLV